MIKEAKNIDFYTSGRQPSQKDFDRISEWIKQNRASLTGEQVIQKKLDKINSLKNLDLTNLPKRQS
jgi:hypothetical protein